MSDFNAGLSRIDEIELWNDIGPIVDRIESDLFG